MADKIDQLKIGTTSYDIDLPKDASIDIAAAVVGGTAVVTQADLTVLPNPIAELPPTGAVNVPIYITDAGNFAPITYIHVASVRTGTISATANGTALGSSTSAFRVYATTVGASTVVSDTVTAGGVYAKANGATLGSSTSAFRVYATTVGASTVVSDTITATTASMSYTSSYTVASNFMSSNYLYCSLISATTYLGISSSATTATANTTRIDPRCLITTGAPAIGGSYGSVSRLFEVRCSITPGTSTTAPSIFSVIGPRFTSSTAATTTFDGSLSVNTGIQVNGSIVVGTSTANAGYLDGSDGVGIFPQTGN